MGIKDLSKVLRAEAKDCYQITKLPSLSGTRVAIDGHNVMYINMAIAKKKIVNKTDVATEEPNESEIQQEWIRMILEFCCTFLSYNITPVFVLDGTHILEKTETKEERKEQKEKILNKILDIRKELVDVDPLLYSVSSVADLRKYMCQIIPVTDDNIEVLKLTLNGIGIPLVQAKHDGEQLCSMLCIEGKVSAVYSTDTDNIVYGCPLVLNGFANPTYDEKGLRIHQCDSVVYKDVLKGLNLTQKEFIDMCILLGCDFNNKIKGVGPVTALKLIKENGSLDDLPQKYNTECLNYKRCRELFSTVNSKSLIVSGELDINKDILAKSGRDTLDYVKNSQFMSKLLALYKELPSPKDVDRKPPKPKVKIVAN